MSAPVINNHIVWAIVSIFLFWPTAIPAILNAIKVKPALAQNDISAAEEASAKAKKWCKVTTIIFAVIVVLSIVMSIVGVCMVSSNMSRYAY